MKKTSHKKLIETLENILDPRVVFTRSAQMLGSQGGKARARSLSKKELSAHAKKMVDAREAKKRTKSVPPMKSTHLTT